MVFKPEYITDEIFNVYVEPSAQQDPSKVGLTWYCESISEDDFKI